MNNELENLLHLRSILQQNENFEKLKLINIKIAEILKKTNISDNKKMSDYIFEEMENDLLNDDFSIFRDFDKKQTEKQTENKLKLDDLMSNIDLKQILYSDNESNTISDNNKMEISNNNNAKFEPASNLTTLNLNKNNKLKKSKNSKINGCDDKLVEAIKNGF
ncbi:hypothetical protein MHBO_005163 [Bonamia ostreae]|uniref:Uncharacterized protein n=1 Tax=Bonamia ostreae TaxID=126728 RepID=A0ABV2AV71_9EUKA